MRRVLPPILANSRQPLPGGCRQIHQPRERGFALLLIFFMAGAVALMLYRQMPRMAFERERDKEQVLIDRGEQYIRAIQLFQRANGGAWPQRIEDLEDTNDKRFLRRRYIDPYTGKDEWRIIHTNGQFLTDSLVEKPPESATSQSQNASNTQQDTGAQVNAAVIQRPSDVTLPNSQAMNQPGGVPTQFPNQPPVPNQLYPNQPQVPGQQNFGQPGGLPQGFRLPNGQQVTGAPGQFNPAQQFPGQQPQVAGQNPNQFTPQFPGQQFPGQPPPPGVQVNNQFPGQQPQPQTGNQPGFTPAFPGQQWPGQQFPGQSPPPGFRVDNGRLVPITQPPGQQPAVAGTPATPGAPANQQQNSAINLINQLLTTPRTPPAGVGQPQNNALGGGIAGVASTHKGPSIKAYKERSKYEEWEFVYRPQTNTGGGQNQGKQPQTGQPVTPGAR